MLRLEITLHVYRTRATSTSGPGHGQMNRTGHSVTLKLDFGGQSRSSMDQIPLWEYILNLSE